MSEVSYRQWEMVCLNMEGEFHRGYLETSTGIKVGPEALLRPHPEMGNRIIVLDSEGSVLLKVEGGHVDMPVLGGEENEEILIMSKMQDTRKCNDDGCFFALYHRDGVNYLPVPKDSVLVGCVVPSKDRSYYCHDEDPFGMTRRELWLLREFLYDIFEQDAYAIFNVPLDGLWEKLQAVKREKNICLTLSGE